MRCVWKTTKTYSLPNYIFSVIKLDTNQFSSISFFLGFPHKHFVIGSFLYYQILFWIIFFRDLVLLVAGKQSLLSTPDMSSCPNWDLPPLFSQHRILEMIGLRFDRRHTHILELTRVAFLTKACINCQSRDISNKTFYSPR